VKEYTVTFINQLGRFFSELEL